MFFNNEHWFSDDQKSSWPRPSSRLDDPMNDPITDPNSGLKFRPPRSKIFAGILGARIWPNTPSHCLRVLTVVMPRTNEVFSRTLMNETRFLTSN